MAGTWVGGVQLIGEIASTPLDRNRPLWEMYVAENFAPPDCFINHMVTPGRRFATAPLA